MNCAWAIHAIPGVLFAGLCAFFAVTVSPWWLAGLIFAAMILPDMPNG